MQRLRVVQAWVRIGLATLTVALSACPLPGAARCSSDDACGPGQGCRGGDCVTLCNNTLDCSRVQRCVEGVCVTDPTLATDAGLAGSSTQPARSSSGDNPAGGSSGGPHSSSAAVAPTSGASAQGSSSSHATSLEPGTRTAGDARLVPAAERMVGQRYRVVGRLSGGAQALGGNSYVVKARWVGGAP